MENKSKEGKLRTIVKEAPAWISILISIGTLIFALGVMHNNVQSVLSRMDKMDDTNLQIIRIDGAISNLQTQVNNTNEIQKRANDSVDGLTDAVVDLGNSVSNLQGKLDTMPPPSRRKNR